MYNFVKQHLDDCFWLHILINEQTMESFVEVLFSYFSVIGRTLWIYTIRFTILWSRTTYDTIFLLSYTIKAKSISFVNNYTTIPCNSTSLNASHPSQYHHEECDDWTSVNTCQIFFVLRTMSTCAMKIHLYNHWFDRRSCHYLSIADSTCHQIKSMDSLKISALR